MMRYSHLVPKVIRARLDVFRAAKLGKSSGIPADFSQPSGRLKT
jgi:hypothetical protein